MQSFESIWHYKFLLQREFTVFKVIKNKRNSLFYKSNLINSSAKLVMKIFFTNPFIIWKKVHEDLLSAFTHLMLYSEANRLYICIFDFNFVNILEDQNFFSLACVDSRCFHRFRSKLFHRNFYRYWLDYFPIAIMFNLKILSKSKHMTTEIQRSELLDFNAWEYRDMNKKSYDSLEKFNDYLSTNRIQMDIFFRDK
jgi:hypothetical protein